MLLHHGKSDWIHLNVLLGFFFSFFLSLFFKVCMIICKHFICHFILLHVYRFCTYTISVYAICAVNIFILAISYFEIKHMEHFLDYCAD